MAARPALTARQLNRATLARQLLLRREHLAVPEAVRRIVAIQAQEPASAYLALWARVADLEPADVDAAIAEAQIVKATLMRMTIHAVHVADQPVFHEAMQPTFRAGRLGDRRYLVAGLSADDGVALAERVAEFAREPRTMPEIERHLSEHVADPRSVWWALRTLAPLVHAPTGGPWAFRTKAFAAPPGPRFAGSTDEALGALIRRYLEGFGPATIADIGQFGFIPRGRVRAALPLAGELVELDGPDGKRLLDVPGGAIPDGDAPAPARLLPMWDSILLAYDDRSRIIPPDLRREVIRTNGDTLPTVLVDGTVAGVWRPVDGEIEVTAFRPIDGETWNQLEGEASSLLRFLAGRDPAVYARYRRWWARLPDPVEVRRLPA